MPKYPAYKQINLEFHESEFGKKKFYNNQHVTSHSNTINNSFNNNIYLQKAGKLKQTNFRRFKSKSENRKSITYKNKQSKCGCDKNYNITSSITKKYLNLKSKQKPKKQYYYPKSLKRKIIKSKFHK